MNELDELRLAIVALIFHDANASDIARSGTRNEDDTVFRAGDAEDAIGESVDRDGNFFHGRSEASTEPDTRLERPINRYGCQPGRFGVPPRISQHTGLRSFPRAKTDRA